MCVHPRVFNTTRFIQIQLTDYNDLNYKLQPVRLM